MDATHLVRGFLVAAVACSAAAQTATVRTTTGCSVTEACTFTSNSIPPNTTIASLQRIVVGSSSAAFAAAAVDGTAPLFPTFALDASSVGCFVPSSADAGGAIEWTVQGPAQGWFLVELSANTGGSINHQANASVAVTGPGVNESIVLLTHGMSQARSVRTFQTFTGAVTFRCEGLVAASSAMPRMAQAHVAVRFSFSVLPPVEQVHYGNVCGMGIRLTDLTTATTHALTFDMFGAFPSSPVVMILGPRRVSMPIGTCTVLAQPVVGVPLFSDAGGRAVWPLVVPGPVRSLPIDVQSLSYDAALQVRTSDGIEVTFVD